jgi:hypothetical protein
MSSAGVLLEGHARPVGHSRAFTLHVNDAAGLADHVGRFRGDLALDPRPVDALVAAADHRPGRTDLHQHDRARLQPMWRMDGAVLRRGVGGETNQHHARARVAVGHEGRW